MFMASPTLKVGHSHAFGSRTYAIRHEYFSPPLIDLHAVRRTTDRLTHCIVGEYRKDDSHSLPFGNAAQHLDPAHMLELTQISLRYIPVYLHAERRAQLEGWKRRLILAILNCTPISFIEPALQPLCGDEVSSVSRRFL